MSSDIIRGEDAQFIIKLRLPNGDPYDLTGLTIARLLFRNTAASYHEVDMSVIPSTYASKLYAGVTYSSELAGDLGNDITLVFTGSNTIKNVCDAWNAANPLNIVVNDAVSDSAAPTAGTVSLSGGQDTYQKISVIDPPILGKLSILLATADTSQFKSGKKLPIHLILAKGTGVGDRKKIIIENAINVIDSPT